MSDACGAIRGILRRQEQIGPMTGLSEANGPEEDR